MGGWFFYAMRTPGAIIEAWGRETPSGDGIAIRYRASIQF